MTRHVLSEKNGNLNFDKEYCGSTQNVVKSVLLDRADAGVTLSPTLENDPQIDQGAIRRILETGEIPSHPLAAHPRVPVSIQAAVQKAVLALGETSVGTELLGTVWLASPVATDYDKDYRALEVVDVKKLSDWGE